MLVLFLVYYNKFEANANAFFVCPSILFSFFFSMKGIVSVKTKKEVGR